MQLALGLSVHTGWAAAMVAGGDWDRPVVAAREHVELLGGEERFVFHRAAEQPRASAETWLAKAEAEAESRARGAMERLARSHGLARCAVVAKAGGRLPLAEVLAAHPRIHAAEGAFYRDVFESAAKAAGMAVTVIAPRSLDAKDPRLAKVGRLVGRPWTADWKVAFLAALSGALRP